MTLILSFSLIFLIVILIKLLYVSIKEAENNFLKLIKIKRDPVVFLSQLSHGKRLEIPEINTWLVFGNEDSNVVITVFLSFHCSFCARKFKSIKALIDNDLKLMVRLTFAPPKDELSNRMTNLICSFIENSESNKALELIERWYDTKAKQKDRFFETYQTVKESKIKSGFIYFNSELFNLNRIDRVPAIYVNGYPMPEMYEMEDIQYLNEYFEIEQSEFKESVV